MLRTLQFQCGLCLEVRFAEVHQYALLLCEGLLQRLVLFKNGLHEAGSASSLQFFIALAEWFCGWLLTYRIAHR